MIKGIFMTQENSIFSKNKVMLIFNYFLSGLIILIGLVIMMESFIGGLLIAVGGVLFLEKIKNQLNQRFFKDRFNHKKFINFAVIVTIFCGLFYAIDDSENKTNIENWNKNSDTILMEISNQLQEQNLSGAKFNFEKFEQIAKNDKTFIELKSAYEKAAAAAEEVKAAKAKEQAEAKNLPNGKLIFYKDSGSSSNNISIAQYEYACKQSGSISNESIRIQGAVNGLIRTILDTNGLGSIKNKFISWNAEEQVCVGIFDIVGTYNGTTYNKKYGGYIYTFDKDSSGMLGNIGGYVSEIN
jgi:hypothetical protein